MGPMVPAKPAKALKLIADKPNRFFWYQKKVNLKDDLLVGPFDFEGEANHIAPQTWTKLKDTAEAMQVDVSNLNRKIPLDGKGGSADREGQAYFSRRWYEADGQDVEAEECQATSDASNLSPK